MFLSSTQFCVIIYLFEYFCSYFCSLLCLYCWVPNLFDLGHIYPYFVLNSIFIMLLNLPTLLFMSICLFVVFVFLLYFCFFLSFFYYFFVVLLSFFIFIIYIGYLGPIDNSERRLFRAGRDAVKCYYVVQNEGEKEWRKR